MPSVGDDYGSKTEQARAKLARDWVAHLTAKGFGWMKAREVAARRARKNMPVPA